MESVVRTTAAVLTEPPLPGGEPWLPWLPPEDATATPPATAPPTRAPATAAIAATRLAENSATGTARAVAVELDRPRLGEPRLAKPGTPVLWAHNVEASGRPGCSGLSHPPRRD